MIIDNHRRHAPPYHNTARHWTENRIYKKRNGKYQRKKGKMSGKKLRKEEIGKRWKKGRNKRWLYSSPLPLTLETHKCVGPSVPIFLSLRLQALCSFIPISWSSFSTSARSWMSWSLLACISRLATGLWVLGFGGRTCSRSWISRRSAARRMVSWSCSNSSCERWSLGSWGSSLGADAGRWSGWISCGGSGVETARMESVRGVGMYCAGIEGIAGESLRDISVGWVRGAKVDWRMWSLAGSLYREAWVATVEIVFDRWWSPSRSRLSSQSSIETKFGGFTAAIWIGDSAPKSESCLLRPATFPLTTFPNPNPRPREGACWDEDEKSMVAALSKPGATKVSDGCVELALLKLDGAGLRATLSFRRGAFIVWLGILGCLIESGLIVRFEFKAEEPGGEGYRRVFILSGGGGARSSSS